MIRSLSFSIAALGFLLTQSSKADFAADLRAEWTIDAAYTDQQITKVAFKQSLYGITFAHWIVAATGTDEFAAHIVDGDYHLVGFDIGAIALEEALTLLVEQATNLPNLASWVLAVHEMGLRSTAFALEVDALSIQHNRYFQARPFNSYATILNLEPFEFLDGVNMIKEGNGWLFTTSGYLSPLPSGSHLKPEEFYPLAEAAWLSVNTDATQLDQERQILCDLFTAELAIGLAQDSLTFPAAGTTGATLEWDCVAGTEFSLDHSTNLGGWTRTGPHTATGNSIRVVLSGLPASNSRFFRIVSE